MLNMFRVLAAFVFLSSSALAAQIPDAEKAALGQMVLEAMQREATLRARVLTLEIELEAARKPHSDTSANPKP
jgi:hypothetical protein